jgi:hypothetical protein
VVAAPPSSFVNVPPTVNVIPFASVKPEVVEPMVNAPVEVACSINEYEPPPWSTTVPNEDDPADMVAASVLWKWIVPSLLV